MHDDECRERFKFPFHIFGIVATPRNSTSKEQINREIIIMCIEALLCSLFILYDSFYVHFLSCNTIIIARARERLREEGLK